MLELSKGNMIFDIVALINSDVIITADLADFSNEVKRKCGFSFEQITEGIMYIRTKSEGD